MRYGDPWADAPGERDPLRRLRGRLVLPVTVWLANASGTGYEVGLTVSSVLVAQGDPAMLAGLVSPASELADVLTSGPSCFVAHVLSAQHKRLAQHFAGELPAPADLLTTRPSAYGPLLEAAGDRLLCRTVSTKPFGWSLLVEAEVAEAQVGAAGKALAWWRGGFQVLPAPGSGAPGPADPADHGAPAAPAAPADSGAPAAPATPATGPAGPATASDATAGAGRDADARRDGDHPVTR